MNGSTNFSAKLGSWIKKTYIAIAKFFKENIWAGLLGITTIILISILIFQGVVKSIEKNSNNTIESKVAIQKIANGIKEYKEYKDDTNKHKDNRATIITSSEIMDKLNNGDTFILVIGAASCAHCKQFYTTINRYVDAGHIIYYLDIDDNSDLALHSNLTELVDRLLNDIPEDRGITEFSTPTTIYIENGEFADALLGAYGMEGGVNYQIFCDVVEGKYVGKPAYKLQ